MLFFLYYVFGWSWIEIFYCVMIFLVVVFFCVLVVFIIFVLLFVILNGVKKGILFKGGVYLERLSYLSVIVFDKIGMLIKGKSEVINVIVCFDINE